MGEDEGMLPIQTNGVAVEVLVVDLWAGVSICPFASCGQLGSSGHIRETAVGYPRPHLIIILCRFDRW